MIQEFLGGLQDVGSELLSGIFWLAVFIAIYWLSQKIKRNVQNRRNAKFIQRVDRYRRGIR